jgi:hypothetical protein
MAFPRVGSDRIAEIWIYTNLLQPPQALSGRFCPVSTVFVIQSDAEAHPLDTSNGQA